MKRSIFTSQFRNNSADVGRLNDTLRAGVLLLLLKL